jgi:serine protease Do
MGDRSSGSGVIVQRKGSMYTVLTNWHVVSLSDRVPTVLTSDGGQYVAQQVQQIGQIDLAIVRFSRDRSDRWLSDCVATIAPTVQVGESVYAAGFPMYRSGTVNSTLNLGIKNFELTSGTVTLRLEKRLEQGYSLGYSNAVVVGMSGGPVFNAQGQLVGVNGRVKDRDPAFGVYGFEDGTEPDENLLKQMAQSSFGILIEPDFVRQFQ